MSWGDAPPTGCGPGGPAGPWHSWTGSCRPKRSRSIRTQPRCATAALRSRAAVSPVQSVRNRGNAPIDWHGDREPARLLRRLSAPRNDVFYMALSSLRGAGAFRRRPRGNLAVLSLPECGTKDQRDCVVAYRLLAVSWGGCAGSAFIVRKGPAPAGFMGIWDYLRLTA